MTPEIQAIFQHIRRNNRWALGQTPDELVERVRVVISELMLEGLDRGDGLDGVPMLLDVDSDMEFSNDEDLLEAEAEASRFLATVVAKIIMGESVFIRKMS